MPLSQRVVAQVRLHEEGAARVRTLGRLDESGERVESVVVGVRDALRPIAQAEVQQDRRRVVGEHAVLLAAAQQGLPCQHVREQRERGVRAARRVEQRAEERGIVEQRVEPVFVQGLLAALARLGTVLRDEREREGRVFAGQPGTDVRQDHRLFLQSIVALSYRA
jgi:hypothetical protein